MYIYIYMYIFIYICTCIYIHLCMYLYDTCAWTPNRVSRTHQLGSLCNRCPVSGHLLRMQVWGYLRLPLRRPRLPLTTGNHGYQIKSLGKELRTPQAIAVWGIYTYIQIELYIYIYMYVYIYTYTNIYIYTYIHIYIYIYDTCAWTPNRVSRTYQVESLGNSWMERT